MFRKREIERDQAVGIAHQDALIQVQKRTAEANKEAVEAKRVIDVGQADIAREVQLKTSEALKQKQQIEAEGKAQEIRLEGQAQADMIQAAKVATAYDNQPKRIRND